MHATQGPLQGFLSSSVQVPDFKKHLLQNEFKFVEHETATCINQFMKEYIERAFMEACVKFIKQTQNITEEYLPQIDVDQFSIQLLGK